MEAGALLFLLNFIDILSRLIAVKNKSLDPYGNLGISNYTLTLCETTPSVLQEAAVRLNQRSCIDKGAISNAISSALLPCNILLHRGETGR